MTIAIYKIVCKNPDIKDFYIGRAINLNNRISQHKTAINKNTMNNKLYNFIRLNGGFNNFKFEIIQELNNKNKSIIGEIEKEYIMIFKPSLNSQKFEIDTTNKKNYMREWSIKNIQKIKNQKSNKKIKCSCGAFMTPNNLKHHKKLPVHFKRLKILGLGTL